ncbi:MAG: polysaccharide deacetylase family protein [Candidatus Brocadiaceae bacterium]|nr:polysaccharide deacetylase family protein [Candidatus Brocadiaceae bacterium]
MISFNKRLLKGTLLLLGSGQNLSILTYHRVHKEQDPICPNGVDASTFEWHMELISRYFTVLSLDDAIDLLCANNLPIGSLCITFDDGYADNAEIALPILKKYGLTATFFVASGYLNGGRMWNDTVIEAIRCMPKGLLDLSDISLGQYHLFSWQDRNECSQTIIDQVKHYPQDKRQLLTEHIAGRVPKPLPDNLMMTNDQVRELSQAGMKIGGHTVSHPNLATINIEQAKSEILGGKESLEEITGTPVRLFAYPNGKPERDYLPEHAELVNELGFMAAVSTQWGVSSSKTDLYQLRRFTPWDNTPGRFMLRLIKNYL